MSRVISEFLIGIGWEKSEFDKGTRGIERGMEGVKTTATTTGAAITAAFIGAGLRVNDLAKQATNLDRAMYSSTGATTWAQSFGSAIKQAGGDAEEALSIIKRADQMRDQLSVGQGAWVDELSRIGFDTGDLAQATDSQDLIGRISTQFSHLNDQQQRLAKDSLGLSDSTFKLFQQGGDALERQVSALQKQQGYTQSLLNQQKDYTQQVIEAELAWDKLGNTVSGVMLPGMTKLAEKAESFINAADSFVKEHPEATERAATAGTVIASGAAIAGIGALGSKIGIPGAGLLRGAGPLGVGLSVAYGANEYADWVERNSGPKQQLSDNGMYYKDSWVGQGVNWLSAPREDKNPLLIGTHPVPQEHQPEALYPVPLVQKPQSQQTTVNAPEALYPVPLVDKPVMSGYQPSYLESPTPAPADERKALLSGYDPSYLQNQYEGGMSDSAMERMGGKLLDALRNTGAIQVKNDVTLNAHVELDGRQFGNLVDDRIDYHNRNAMDEMTTQVER